MLELSIVKNSMFCVESVGLWLVALLSGNARAKGEVMSIRLTLPTTDQHLTHSSPNDTPACATQYLCLVSRSSISGLFGKKLSWSDADAKRFHQSRTELYNSIGSLGGIVPCMLHLGDDLYEVSLKRAVKHIVESIIGRPLPVYLSFMDMMLLLTLMCSYRTIVELIYNMAPLDNSFWGLSFSITVYFLMRDIAIMASLSSIQEHLWRRYISGFGNIVGFFAMISTLTTLIIIHRHGDIENRNFLGLVSGLLWWKFLLQIKGMSESLATLIYTIIEIAGSLVYFLMIFLVAIFFFADMVDVVKKTSGDCDGLEDGYDTFCSLTPLQTYLAMYGIMLGGFEISSLEGTSALVSLLFVAASFCGVIVLVNILIAIVTGQYEVAKQRSCALFAR